MVRPMRADELRNLTEAELEQKAREFKEELFNLRFQHATAQLDNPMRIKEVKRIIARIKTVLRERELGIERA
ncbi:MAG: large subunit ribosomal protein L29 [Halanaerobium sp. 4-GBenrich]|uniref:Large ribosomal subunit protein uL29 n=2 Tax=Halanaerobium congolense TaxID=54121 RepID=A0A1G6Q4K1_9FIRM|nr:50S ribosomal protein L29 [Halanaerobium congolense]ODS50792.1 MAG: large subunit ribosomal protein L29 [Halanaerobium sp. 4-GBenrich]PTX15552.1 large subunit ribosomal protein L29 [Halanaerobium congolense]TDS31639.1 large subunit ribosomal protein L29 [Halanaerobium congolense]TDX43055.1 large subunit ribosomal protein L29 [Halanaerobium congolense]SDC87402.1 large subunit ribosomal protein L29 [Halanaerobium congolense]